MTTLKRSHIFDTLKPGDSAGWERVYRASDLHAWRAAHGDVAVAEDDWAFAIAAAAGLLSSGFAGLVGSHLPGPGSTILGLSLNPEAGLPLDRPVRLSLTIAECRAAERIVMIDARATDADGAVIATGQLMVAPPDQPVAVVLAEHRLDDLVVRARELPPMRTAVVHPLSLDALSGAVAAARAGLIDPVLYGPEEALRALAAGNGLDISQYAIVDTSGEADSAARAAHDAGEGRARALMKGSLHTNILLHAVLQADAGLRTGRVLSHVALISAPTHARRFAVTDAALNIAPTLDQKRGIAQNAIGFMRAIGVARPKLAVIAAVELVQANMPATLEAAALAKMADRGQIVGGIVDGPLDLDAAVDSQAARAKGIASPVAGEADILLVPNIETGNALYKVMGFTANAQTAGLVLGAAVPIILTSRADTDAARLFSAAAAALYADALARRPDDIIPACAE